MPEETGSVEHFKNGGIVPKQSGTFHFSFGGCCNPFPEGYLEQLKKMSQLEKNRLLFGNWEPDPEHVKAEACHNIWAHWMKYMFSILPKEGAFYIIPLKQSEQWIRQMNTDFWRLPERERESDYGVAKMFLRDLTIEKKEPVKSHQFLVDNGETFKTGEVFKFDQHNCHVITRPINEYVYEFEIYEATRQPDESYIYYNNSNGTPETVDSIHQAIWLAKGSIKFDSCSHWEFHDQANCAIHFCGKKDLQRIMTVMSFCWDIAKSKIKNWQGD